jgi:hypothetical protein
MSTGKTYTIVWEDGKRSVVKLSRILEEHYTQHNINCKSCGLSLAENNWTKIEKESTGDLHYYICPACGRVTYIEPVPVLQLKTNKKKGKGRGLKLNINIFKKNNHNHTNNNNKSKK